LSTLTVRRSRIGACRGFQRGSRWGSNPEVGSHGREVRHVEESPCRSLEFGRGLYCSHTSYVRAMRSAAGPSSCPGSMPARRADNVARCASPNASGSTSSLPHLLLLNFMSETVDADPGIESSRTLIRSDSERQIARSNALLESGQAELLHHSPPSGRFPLASVNSQMQQGCQHRNRGAAKASSCSQC